MTTTRVKRMLSSAPYYYRFSDLYNQLQEASGQEYDTIEEKNLDLRNQLSITKATWGLKYWEELLDIKTTETNNYEIRRSRVLAKWRSVGNFSADLIKSIAEAFINGEISVRIDTENYAVYITFRDEEGIPPNLEDLKQQLEEIVHAHYGIEIEINVLVWNEWDWADLTFNEFEDKNFTWDKLEVWTPKYLTWNLWDRKNEKWDNLDDMDLTWNELEVWIVEKALL